jgi:hypothetical protein
LHPGAAVSDLDQEVSIAVNPHSPVAVLIELGVAGSDEFELRILNQIAERFVFLEGRQAGVWPNGPAAPGLVRLGSLLLRRRLLASDGSSCLDGGS